MLIRIFCNLNYTALKKFTLLLAAGFLFFSMQVAFGQTTPKARISAEEKSAAVASRNTPPGILQRCGTTEAYEQLFRQNPAFKAQFEANQRRLAEVSRQRRETSRVTALEDTVAVVIHVIGSAALQAQVTDAILQSQIDTLNVDYNGKNADSVRIPAAFKPVFGKMGITFILAKTDPNGFPTTGIERRTNNITFSSGTADNAKRTANGGLDAWDGTKYLNLWVAELTGGLLGISVFPGDPRPLGLHGFLCDYRAFGSNANYLYPEFNKGRTTTHELGHFLNLRHIWGDDGTGSQFNICTPGTSCNGSDFVDDTPNQCVMNFENPDINGTGVVVTDICSPTAPGVMYQNFMDYCDDVALVMFTKGQNTRMEDAFNSPDRGPLLSSLAYNPPPPSAGNDARISAIITPVNGSTFACGSTVAPQVTIMNMGSNALSTASVVVRINGAAVGSPFAWTATTPLAQGQSANITLPTITLPAGASVIKIHSTLPNNQVDANPANDTSTATVTRVDPQALPATNDFETVFLSPGFSIKNPDNDALEWIWVTPGTGGTGTGSAAADNYNEDAVGTFDDLLTPTFLNTGLLATDSIYISFDLAYKFYADIFGSISDELQVLVTNNCGASYTTLFQGTGNAIATGSSSSLFIPTPADWRKRTFAIGQNIFSGGNFQFVIRNVNNWGNVMWIDNVNVALKPRKDLQASAITRPAVTECTSNFTPAFTVRNNGGQTITAFKVGYSLNGGAAVEVAVNQTLVPGATYTHTFPAITFPTGTHSIRFYGIDPLSAEGGTDGTPANNEITRTFIVPAKQVNVSEGFEGATFPPASWLRINADNGVTWQRVNYGKSSSFSASVNNYDYATNTYLFDHLQTPIVRTDGADSVIITFDVAHQPYEDETGISVDNLGVLASRNCGSTFSVIYSKTGEDLATVLPGTEDHYVPGPDDWRREKVVFDLTTTPATESIFQFRNGNAYGNDIYIDNINIEPKFKRDLKIESIEPPIACSTNYTPTAVVRNNGTNTITGFKVAYTVNNGAPAVTTVTGINFLKNTTMNVALTAATLNAGNNTIKVYSFDPIGAGAVVGDQYLVNDTITRTVATATTVQNSIVQTFDATTFPPTGWAVGNPDGALTWARSAAGNNSTGSAFLRNFTYYTGNGQRDGLFSPVLQFSQADSLTLTFDVAATKVDYGDPATMALDTLEVLITKDCGNTYTSVYKKWGNTLQTVGNVSTGGQFAEFTPNGTYLWRNEKVNLAPAAGANTGNLQVVFRNSSNNRNNIYIDNVNITAKTLPDRLKADGYIVSPSPFTTQFKVWFIQAPADLKYISVYNSAGHRIWSKEYSNNTANVLQVDLTGKPAGTYIVRIGYGGKEVETKIVKTN